MDEGLDPVDAEVGVHSDRVKLKRNRVRASNRGAAQEPCRVRVRGGAYVAALDVADHEQALLARVRDRLHKGLEAGPAKLLEEGRLRLHPCRVGQDRVDDAPAELEQGRGRAFEGLAEPGEVRLPNRLGKAVEPRVDANDDPRVLPLYGLGETIGEVGQGRPPFVARSLLRILIDDGARCAPYGYGCVTTTRST